MKFIIKQWPDQSATLMTENGYALATFDSLSEARYACAEWDRTHKERGYEVRTEAIR
jgi:hypothetical protein